MSYVDAGVSASQSNSNQSGYTGAVNVGGNSGGISMPVIAMIAGAAIIIVIVIFKSRRKK